MSNKLFERNDIEKGYEDDIPLEDPNHLGELDASDQIIEHLNWLSDSAMSQHYKMSGLDQLIQSMESLIIRKDISVEAYHLLSIAKNSILGKEYKGYKEMTLESKGEPFGIIQKTYILEGLWSDLVALDENLRNKFSRMSERINHFYQNSIKRVGRIKGKVANLLSDVEKKEGFQKTPNVEIPLNFINLIPYPHTAGSLDALASTIKSGSFSDKAGDHIKKSLYSLKGFSLKSEIGLEQMARKITDNPLAEIISGIENDGYTLLAHDSDHEVHTGGMKILKSKHGLLGYVHIMIQVNYNKDNMVTGVNVTYSHADKGKGKLAGQTTTIPTLTHKEQIDTLNAITEVSNSVDHYKGEKGKIEKGITEIEKELIRLLNELSKNKDILRKADYIAYQKVSNYLYSLFNSSWLIQGPILLITMNALDICDATFHYVQQSHKATDSTRL